MSGHRTSPSLSVMSCKNRFSPSLILLSSINCCPSELWYLFLLLAWQTDALRRNQFPRLKKVDSLTWNFSHTTQERSGNVLSKCFMFFQVSCFLLSKCSMFFTFFFNLLSEKTQGFGICEFILLSFYHQPDQQQFVKTFYTGKTEIWAFSRLFNFLV